MTDSSWASQDGKPQVRVTLHPSANPLPLGFGALAVGAMVTAALQLHWLAPAQQAGVGAALLWFVAPLQLLACFVAFPARDVAAATGMGVLAGSWAVLGWASLTSPEPTSPVVGIVLLSASMLLVVAASTAVQAKIVPALVLGTAALRFLCAGLYELYPDSAWRVLAGVVGLLLAPLAVYAALALAWEDGARATALPLGRRPGGPAALDNGFGERMTAVDREAGVRPQL